MDTYINTIHSTRYSSILIIINLVKVSIFVEILPVYSFIEYYIVHNHDYFDLFFRMTLDNKYFYVSQC